jgi:hypothetical protein
MRQAILVGAFIAASLLAAAVIVAVLSIEAVGRLIF